MPNVERVLKKLEGMACGGHPDHGTPDAIFREAADCIILLRGPVAPIPMRLPCPDCGELHIDEGEFATKHHHTHSCQHCGMTWRPAVIATVGVRFLPGFKNS